MKDWNETAKPYELECGHKVWLKTAPETLEEFLYCSQCAAYVEQSPAAATLRGVWVVHADENFRSKRISLRQYMGECTYDECNEKVTRRSWFALRDYMHSHYMRKHTRFGITIETDKKPDKAWTRKTTEPPF